MFFFEELSELLSYCVLSRCFRFVFSKQPICQKLSKAQGAVDSVSQPESMTIFHCECCSVGIPVVFKLSWNSLLSLSAQRRKKTLPIFSRFAEFNACCVVDFCGFCSLAPVTYCGLKVSSALLFGTLCKHRGKHHMIHAIYMQHCDEAFRNC